MVDVVKLVLEVFAANAIPAYAELPEGVGRPVIRVEEAGGVLPTSLQPDNWITQDVQLDCWGTTKAEARNLIGDAYQALRAFGEYEAGTLRRCSALGAFTYERDPDWPINGQDGPRYLLIVRIEARD